MNDIGDVIGRVVISEDTNENVSDHRFSRSTPCYLFVRSFARSFARSFTRSFVRSFARSFVRSFVRSFARSNPSFELQASILLKAFRGQES